jgi:hypothetical protein
MVCMRRLFASLAFVAVLLAVPQTALAVGPVTITTPPPLPTPFYTSSPAITIGWSDATDAIIYRVFRADDPGCTSYTNISGDIIIPGTLTYADSLATAGQGTYCYQVQAQDALVGVTTSAAVTIVYDAIPPLFTGVSRTGEEGCSTPFTVTAATATDASPVTFVADVVPPLLTGPLPYIPTGNPYDLVQVMVTATDAAGNTSNSAAVSGRIADGTGPTDPPTLEVTTDPGAQQATLNWDPVTAEGAPVAQYRLRTKGPQGLKNQNFSVMPVVVTGLQVDATYEFTLDAQDQCFRFGPTSVRLVRLNDTTPPTSPILATPSFDPATKVVNLSWVAASDNIQVDHYDILRNGVPINATDATVFTDPSPGEHTLLSYVVRAVDTNGNSTESAPAPVQTPDWTKPTTPLPTPTPDGNTVTLRWPPARDNVGVVGYSVERDGRPAGTMTAAVHLFRDFNLTTGPHVWRVTARDGAGNESTSVPVSLTIKKPVSRASFLAMRMAGNGHRAARYALSGPARLLVDLRVVGTLAKPTLRLYVKSGRARITVWRGTPGSSAPRLRLGSALARRGYVTIRLGRALHSGRIRLVLIASGRIVIVNTDARKPAMKAG